MDHSSEEREIYFHVGLGKVASTYLQHSFFPRLKNIRYLSTHRYKKSKKLILGSREVKFLVSREFDIQFEREVRWFTETFPQSRIIIIFRRHDSWIASQYRRKVKNGFLGDFSDFFDLKNDQGLWKKEQLLFRPKLDIIDQCCQHKPLVLFYEDLRKDPWRFFSQIAQYCGATYDPNNISLDKVHPSYSEKQLKVLRTFCRKVVRKTPKGYRNKWKLWLLYRPWWALFHLVMYAALLIPNKWVTNNPLIEEEDLKAIRAAYQDDWESVKAYAEKHNPHFQPTI
jgi:hypothetical protein